MENIAQVIRDKVAKLREAEGEVTRLRLELAEIRAAANEGIGDSPARHTGRSAKTRASAKGKRSRPIRAGSYVAIAAQVLTAVGRPLHIDELLPQVSKTIGKDISKATLVGQLSEYVRRHEIFDRPEPSTFGLLAWGNGVPESPALTWGEAVAKAM